MPASFQTAKHNVLGRIPGWRAPCSTVKAGHGHHRVTVVSGGTTEPCAIWCCVPADADLSPTSPRFRHLEESLTSGRGC